LLYRNHIKNSGFLLSLKHCLLKKKKNLTTSEIYIFIRYFPVKDHNKEFSHGFFYYPMSENIYFRIYFSTETSYQKNYFSYQ